jgi:hypothetical protein
MEKRVRRERRDEDSSPAENFRARAPEYWPKYVAQEEDRRDEVGNDLG